jgi:RAT1-interacting protein
MPISLNTADGDLTSAQQRSFSPSFDVQTWLRQNPPDACATACLSQPFRLGRGWTKTGEQYSHGDSSGLAPISMSTLPMDLNQGIEEFQAKDPLAKTGVEILIREARVQGFPVDARHCHVLTFRNNLNKMLGTAFDQKQGWRVGACFYQDVLFLDIVKEREERAQNQAQNLEILEKWGYMFEAKCTGARAGNAQNEAGMLVKTRLTPPHVSQYPQETAPLGWRLFIGAEIDAYDPSAIPPGSNTEVPPLESLRELKTMRPPQHHGQYNTLYRLKHPKWWLQSHLAGVPALFLGMRDDNGVVREIHTVRTNDLVKISWENGHKWSPQQALALGAAMLEWVRQCCAHDPGSHLSFRYDPQSQHVGATVVKGGDLLARIQTALSEELSNKTPVKRYNGTDQQSPQCNPYCK